jgi:hypothetical protein
MGKLEDTKLNVPGIDPEISNLVKAINIYGKGMMVTGGSCQGHLDKNHWSFPWVIIQPTYGCFKHYEEFAKSGGAFLHILPNSYTGRLLLRREVKSFRKLMEFAEVIKEFNRQSPVKWRFNRNYLEPATKAANSEELKYLQKNANVLAEYLAA